MAKMLFGIFDLARRGRLPGSPTVVAIHTGGLQPAAHATPSKDQESEH